MYMESEDKELPLHLVKSIDNKDLTKILDTMRVFLKKEEGTIKLFKEYDMSIDEIDYIPMRFDDIDVSAKTSKGIIIFSFALLQDADFFEDYSYARHELVHYAQQTTGNGPTKSLDDEDYLENPNEIEGFQHQIEFIHSHHGEDKAEEYVNDLLEYHDHPEKDKKKLKKLLKNKI